MQQYWEQVLAGTSRVTMCMGVSRRLRRL